MAFNNLQPPDGPFYLAAGGQMRIWMRYPGNGDQGAQWIMAHPLQGEPPTALEVSEFTKVLGYGIGWVNSEGQSGFVPSSFYYEYEVTVTNRGPSGARFNIQGGGNT